jgi:hypothetical protein
MERADRVFTHFLSLSVFKTYANYRYLQIDYGEQYELQRVRCNYARVKGQKLAHLKKSVSRSDTESLHSFMQYSPHEVHDCLAFLESMFLRSLKLSTVKLQRTLLAALILRHRICGIARSGDINLDGHLDMEDINTVERSKTIVVAICNELSGRGDLKTIILSDTLLKAKIVELIGRGDSIALEGLSTNDLQDRIVRGT